MVPEEFGSSEAGKKGGKARAKALDSKTRKEIARKGAAARWQGKDGLPQATHGDTDHPLRIGDIEIQCYVLEDGTRVVSQRGLQASIGISASGGAQRLQGILSKLSAKGIDTKDLEARIRDPLLFWGPTGKTHGFEATILADFCDVILSAREKGGTLQPNQLHIAKQCEILMRGFARVGIIALVDEATGYQEARTRDALAKILEAFIDKELRGWIETFPADFYNHLFRLRGLDYPKDTVKRPQYFGVLTNDIVYKRLAPGVLDELKRITPKDDKGRRKHKYFQRLTSNLGYPKLKEHLGAVVAIMKLSDNWNDFIDKLNRHYPRFGETMLLPFPEDDGTGL